MATWTQVHPTIPVTAPSGKAIDLDHEIAPIVLAAWERGYETRLSCQDMGEAIRGGGFVHMSDEDREWQANRNLGRAMLQLRASAAPAFLTDLGPLYTHGRILASVKVSPEGLDEWAMITFPRNALGQVSEQLCCEG